MGEEMKRLGLFLVVMVPIAVLVTEAVLAVFGKWLGTWAEYVALVIGSGTGYGVASLVEKEVFECRKNRQRDGAHGGKSA